MIDRNEFNISYVMIASFSEKLKIFGTSWTMTLITAWS